jgi:hypothetical protein
MTVADRPVGAREVLGLAAAAVAFVLGLNLISILVPPVGAALGLGPLVIVVLVVGTLAVMLGALRRAGKG